MFHYLTEMPTLDAEGKAVFGSVWVGTQRLIHAGCTLQGPLRGHIPRALLMWHHQLDAHCLKDMQGRSSRTRETVTMTLPERPEQILNPSIHTPRTCIQTHHPFTKFCFPSWMYGSIKNIRCKVYVSIINRDTKKKKNPKPWVLWYLAWSLFFTKHLFKMFMQIWRPFSHPWSFVINDL